MLMPSCGPGRWSQNELVFGSSRCPKDGLLPALRSWVAEYIADFDFEQLARDVVPFLFRA